jgi:hypothetical protein
MLGRVVGSVNISFCIRICGSVILKKYVSGSRRPNNYLKGKILKFFLNILKS